MVSFPRVHDWVTFEDEAGTSWVFDASFLLSDWTCIFGSGCKGVLTEDATELAQGCCSYGAHFSDDGDRKNLVKFAKKLTSSQWQRKSETAKLGGPVEVHEDGTATTRLINDVCCFHNDVAFAGGHGCALHIGAVEASQRPMDWKPEVCWQVPLRLTTDIDDNEHTTYTLREWKRRDWGEGGQDFHWWCTDSPDAFHGASPVYLSLRDEIIELVGIEPYQWFVDHVASRGSEQFLAHPMVRRR